MAKIQNSKQEFTVAIGRRKESVARVRLFAGAGENVVNNQPVDVYFPGAVAKVKFNRPFVVAGVEGKYWISARVEGGGKNGQLDAVVHGIARALSEIDRENNRAPLKKQKLLTRNPRTRERRKVGTGGKARRKKQSPKR